jgi:hypothetical protein
MMKLTHLFAALALPLALSAPAAPAAAQLPAEVDGQPVPSLAPMLKRTAPGVVNISTRGRVQMQQNPMFNDPFFRRFFQMPDQPMEREVSSLGSGVIVDAARGYVLTNHHVIANADEIRVTLQDGRTVEGTDANTIARYPLHFHLVSAAQSEDTGFIVRNCAVEDSPKHGIVHHGGKGLIEDTVVFSCLGSGLFTENGVETGEHRRNLVVGCRTERVGNINGRGDVDDFGHSGHGIWLQGGGVDVRDNVVLTSRHGITFFARPLRFANPTEFPAHNLKPQHQYIAEGREAVGIQEVPGLHERNTIIRCPIGFVLYIGNRHQMAQRDHTLHVDSRVLLSETGLQASYGRMVELRDVKLTGARHGVMTNVGSSDISLVRCSFEGFITGFWLPRRGDQVVEDQAEDGGDGHAGAAHGGDGVAQPLCPRDVDLDILEICRDGQAHEQDEPDDEQVALAGHVSAGQVRDADRGDQPEQGAVQAADDRGGDRRDHRAELGP